MHELPNNSADRPTDGHESAFWEAIAGWVVRAQGGDTGAFELIYRAMWEKAVGFVMKKFSATFSAMDAEDIAQHAFATAWIKLGTLRDPVAFPSWFFKILARKSLAAYRIALSHSVISKAPDDFEVSRFLVPELANVIEGDTASSNPFGLLVRSEVVTAATKRIQHVYDGLTPKRQAVFVAHFVNLFNETETAAATGLRVGTVRSSVSRIRHLIRQDFSTAGLEDVPLSELRLAVTDVLARWSNTLNAFS